MKEASLDLSITGTAGATIDIRACAHWRISAPPGQSTGAFKPDLINAYLAWSEKTCGGIERDLDGWRLVPIRFYSTAEAQISVRAMKAVLE